MASLAAVAAMFVLVLPRVGLLRAAQESKKADAPSGNAENGKRLFNKNGCYECHGREGQGSSMTGPRIAPNPLPFEVISSYVRKPTGEMPPYTAKVISDQELADIYAFLQSRPRPLAAKTNPLLK
jgi:ubiquinol-cytochrome c reductase cytochrome c subunit